MKWIDKTVDKRPILELIYLWYHDYCCGQQLKTGTRELNHLITINADLGNLRIDQVTRQRVMRYRTATPRVRLGLLCKISCLGIKICVKCFKADSINLYCSNLYFDIVLNRQA